MDPAKPKPKASLFGCVMAVVIIGVVLYGSIAGAGFFAWGNGLAGAIAVHRDPGRVQSFESISIYGSRITSSNEELVVTRTWWVSVRNGLLAGMAAVIVLAIFRRRLPKRGAAALLFLGVAAIVSVAGQALSTRTVFQITPRTIEIRNVFSTQRLSFDDVVLMTTSGDMGGGRSGTRNTTAFWKAYDVLLIRSDGEVVTRLLSLPFETREFADLWRDEIARRTTVRSRM